MAKKPKQSRRQKTLPHNLGDRIRCGREPDPATPDLLKVWCFDFYLVTLASMSDAMHDATGTAQRAWSQMAALYDAAGGKMPRIGFDRPSKCTVEEAKTLIRRIIDWCDKAIGNESAEVEQAAYSKMAAKVVAVFSSAIELADILQPLRDEPDKAVGAWRPSTAVRLRFMESLKSIEEIKDTIPSEVLIELQSLAHIAADVSKRCVTAPDVCLFLAESDLKGPATRGWQALTAANPKNAKQFAWAFPPLVTSEVVIPKLVSSVGPIEPNKFVWDGKTAALQPITWRLISHLWGTEKRTARIQETLDAVWGHDCDPSEGALKSAINRLNTQLMEAGIPVSVCQKAGHITVSIAESAGDH